MTTKQKKELSEVNYYEEVFGWGEHDPSEKELELNDKGFDFITNFDKDREPIYRKAAEIHNLKIWVEDEAYGFGNTRLPHAKAFYVDSTVGDLSDFWRTFYQIKGAE